jgi:dipeptidyl aminopeptidase/acylaminoacyl peptidase
LLLEKSDISRLARVGWQAPRPITVKAHDGRSDLYGLMYVPSTLDQARQYPIINHVYPGPQIGSVGPRRFRAARGDSQALAELGFIVVEIDGTGTSLRSKAFRDAAYGNLGENTLPDQVAALQQLIEQHPWIDGTRIGMWGHSGGGGATAAALLRYPDFFKVGVAESGNHDQRGYEGDWGEQYNGLLTGNVEGQSNYSGQDNQSIAAQLKGHLLLMHGVVDDNVPLSQTLLMADAFIKANRDFDMLLLPDQHHGYRGVAGNYATRRRWDYFVRYLQGGEPPPAFELQAGEPHGASTED